MKLLCVEDSATQRHMIDLMLATTGIDIDFASSGPEALEAYQTTEYDAVLMDVDMPDMSGVQAAREIRQMEGGFHLGYTPILFLGNPQVAEDDALNADSHLMKPFTSAALMGALDSLMRTATGSGLHNSLRSTR